jgi:hypothetical protein
MPSAFSVANSPLTANGTLSVTGAGTTAQYVRGDGSLATFPTIAQEAQRLITEVYNSTGATLAKGSIVYINGGQGNLPTVTKAIATGDATSAQTYGVVQSDITNMNNGFVVAMGSLTDLDTQIYPVGTQLYLSGTTAGAWTSTKPYAPQHLVYVGIVVRSHPTQGVVEIRIQNGYELDELHDVSAQNPTNGDILQYVAATDLWTKTAGTTTNIAEGTNLYYTQARFDTAFGNKSTTNLTEGTNLYFTDARARAAITLTTTGTSGAATYSGGTLNIPQYQGVLTNPVTGTGTTNTLPKFTGASTIGNSNITDTGSLITLGSNTTISSGSLGIGTTSLAGFNLRVNKTITGSTSGLGIQSAGAIQSDVSDASYFSSGASTQAATFTLTDVAHFIANQGTIGAGSTITKQYGFRVAASLIGATNNYAFFSDIPSGTNRWNIYMNGTAANYLAGVLNIGTTTLSGFTLDVNGDARVSNSVFYKLFGTSSNYYRVGIRAGTANFEIHNTNIDRADLLITQSTGAATFSSSVTAASFIPTSSTIPTNGMYLSGTNTLGFATNGTLDMTLDANGALGLGSTSLTQYGLRVSKNITGSTVSFGASIDGVIQSDVTSAARLYNTNITTAAASFTLSSLQHYVAGQGTLGAGSVVTNQFGFLVLSNLVGATNNFGFYGEIPSGTNRWNLYMNGTANNYLAGNLGIGSASIDTTMLRISRSFTSTLTTSLFLDSQVSLTATSLQYIQTTASTAASITVNTISHISLTQGTFGAGSTVTTQFGIYIGNLIGATNNYGIFGDIAAGTGRWNLYINGTANNYMAGTLGIGSTSLTNSSLNVSKTITGSTTSIGIIQGGAVQSGVTSTAYGFYNTAITQAAAFTLGTYIHYGSDQSTIGAGSAITTQIGFNASATLIGATNNYGFQGSIPSGTGRWNLFMNGTANNHMAGSLGIGTTTLTGINLNVNKNITGATTSYGILSQGAIQSDVTSSGHYFTTSATVQNTAFTLSNLYHYRATGASSFGSATVTNQYGFIVDNVLTGATNNFGFVGNIPAGTNRWNLYMSGTANNYLAGSLGIGTTSIDTTSRLHLLDSTNGYVGLRLEGSANYAGSDWTLYASSSPLSSSNDFFGIYNNSNTDSATIGYKLIVTKQGTAALGTATPNASAILQADSTNRGFLPPRMTTTQKNAIGTPAAGLMVYDTTLNQMSYYNGTTWINF